MYPFYLRFSFHLALVLVLGPSIANAQGTTPPQKAVNEIRRFEQAYAAAFNKKDTTTVIGMYAPDAIFVQADGSVLNGQDTIRKVIAMGAPNWPEMTIEPESTRVVGQTAW